MCIDINFYDKSLPVDDPPSDGYGRTADAPVFCETGLADREEEETKKLHL